MKTITSKEIKPITSGDKLLKHLIDTSQSSEMYSITYEKNLDKLCSHPIGAVVDLGDSDRGCYLWCARCEQKL